MSSVNPVGMSGIVSLTAGTGALEKGNDPAKMGEAAKQFEGLLLGQILRAARSSDSGWLGSDDSASSCATDFAEEQLANAIAQQGGFGLAQMIRRSLERESSGSPAR